MDEIQTFHLERIKSATVNKMSMAHIPEWLCKHTSLNGAPYSFKDHKYQKRILRDVSGHPAALWPPTKHPVRIEF